MKRDMISLALNSLEERHISETATFSPGAVHGSPERSVRMKKKWIVTFALAAALMLALGITAYAALGLPRSIGTNPMPGTAEYTSLSALPKVEKQVGYPVTVPERFSNGYAFERLSVNGQAVFGESGEVLQEYYSVGATYSKDGAPDLDLWLQPVLKLEGGSEAPAPSQRQMIGGVTVDLNLDHYKVVPEDYEKTEQDLAREAAGHYYISFGSDAVEEREIASVGFTLGDVRYMLMDMAADQSSIDTLTQMAGEVIRAYGS